METIAEQIFETVPEDDGEKDSLYRQDAKPWQILQAVWDDGEEEMRERELRRTIAKLNK